jgi:hypothetical protein
MRSTWNGVVDGMRLMVVMMLVAFNLGYWPGSASMRESRAVLGPCLVDELNGVGGWCPATCAVKFGTVTETCTTKGGGTWGVCQDRCGTCAHADQCKGTSTSGLGCACAHGC